MKSIPVVLIAVASGVATWFLGWWGVLAVAAVAGAYFRRDSGRPWRVALATMIAWALLLAFDALRGPLMRVASTVSGVTAAPAALLLVVTVLLAGLLAWSAATVAGELGQLVSTAQRRTP